jgi:hypothetical protein
MRRQNYDGGFLVPARSLSALGRSRGRLVLAAGGGIVRLCLRRWIARGKGLIQRIVQHSFFVSGFFLGGGTMRAPGTGMLGAYLGLLHIGEFLGKGSA